ncbi:MAG TPA: hypothetical protein PK280_21210, partial [Planctomycetota bacterium]|nr:hypothetical protein [Planctomycetota bacterium]
MRTLPAIREAGAVRSALVLSLALTLLAGCGPELPLSTPEWSADGSRIAFVHYSSEGAGTLFVAEPGGDRPPRRISEDAERCAFSGAKLYFLRRPPEGRKAGAPRSGLCSAALDEEGEPRVDLVLGSGDVRAFTRLQAGPGGLLYIECREKDGKRTFFEFDPAAGKQRQITPEGAEWRAARLSPRGTELAALVPGKDKGLDLVVAQLAGGEPAVVGRLESAQADGAGLAWSPAG